MAHKQDAQNKIGHDSQEKVSGTLDERRKSLWGLNDEPDSTGTDVQAF